MRKVLVLAVLSLCLPAAASEPGQPLDCSDWVSVAPGFTCTELSPLPCEFGSPVCFYGRGIVEPDNEGSVLFVRGTPGNTCTGLFDLELVRSNGTTEEVIGYFPGRCVNEDPPKKDVIRPSDWIRTEVGSPDYYTGTISFDSVNGRVYLPLNSRCEDYPDNFCSDGYEIRWLAAIGGFPTLADVIRVGSDDDENDDDLFDDPWSVPEGGIQDLQLD